MLARATTVLALAGCAAAFAPTMSMDMGRRQVVQTAGTAAAVAVPLLRANPASAAVSADAQEAAAFRARHPSASAPVIAIFDHRGCARQPKPTEYRGERSNDQDDEMCVSVRSPVIQVGNGEASKFLQQVISYQAKGIDGAYYGKGKQ